MGVERTMTGEAEMKELCRTYGKDTARIKMMQAHDPLDRTIDKKRMMIEDAAIEIATESKE